MKTSSQFLTVGLLVAVVFAGALNIGAAPVTINYKQLDNQLRKVITDVQASDNDLLEAISHFGKRTEGPAFWTQIANNTNYSTLHRARCVLALFRRYAQGEVDMYSVSRCTEPAKWLEQSAIYKLDPNDLMSPGAPHPFFPDEGDADGDSIFRIDVLNSWHKIYFRIKGEASLGKFTAQLKGGEENYSITNKEQPLIIEQLGYVDDYDDWINGDH